MAGNRSAARSISPRRTRTGGSSETGCGSGSVRMLMGPDEINVPAKPTPARGHGQYAAIPQIHCFTGSAQHEILTTHYVTGDFTRLVTLHNLVNSGPYSLQSSQSGCGAVGSARRSGRRGRWFKSSHPDQSNPHPTDCPRAAFGPARGAVQGVSNCRCRNTLPLSPRRQRSPCPISPPPGERYREGGREQIAKGGKARQGNLQKVPGDSTDVECRAIRGPRPQHVPNLL